jgi:hypothetical protein
MIPVPKEWCKEKEQINERKRERRKGEREDVKKERKIGLRK